MKHSTPSYSHKIALSTSWSRFCKLGILAVAAASAAGGVAHATGIILDQNSLNLGAGPSYGVLNVSTQVPTQPFGSPPTPADKAAVVAAAQNVVVVRAPTGAAGNAAHALNVSKIRTWANSGYDGGLWDGTGIRSSTAAADANLIGVLGVMMYDNNQTGFPSFLGVASLPSDPIDMTFHQVLLRLTYFGDTDSDGLITVLDYGNQDFYFGSGLNAQGDLNGDGVTDLVDYGVIDFGLGQNNPYGNLGAAYTPPPPPALAGVPEPTAGLLMIGGIGCLLGMRKKKQLN